MLGFPKTILSPDRLPRVPKLSHRSRQLGVPLAPNLLRCRTSDRKAEIRLSLTDDQQDSQVFQEGGDQGYRLDGVASS